MTRREPQNDTINVHSVSVLDVAGVSKLVSSVVGGSMHMWCLDDIGRDSWDRVVSGSCERACLNSPEWGWRPLAAETQGRKENGASLD